MEVTRTQSFVARHFSFGTVLMFLHFVGIFQRLLPWIILAGVIFGAGYLVGAA